MAKAQPEEKTKKEIAKEEAAETLKKIGVRLKSLRIKKGYTNHEKFAYDHDMDRVQYGRYERGVSDMQFSTLLKLVKIFGLTLEEFFSEGF